MLIDGYIQTIMFVVIGTDKLLSYLYTHIMDFESFFSCIEGFIKVTKL